MDLDASRIQTIRPYVFDYVSGVLWLVAVLAAFVQEEHLQRLAASVESIAVQVPHATVPSFVTGFFLIVAGVILPYCVNVILKMPSLILLSLLLNLQRRNDDSEEAKDIVRLRDLAMQTIQRAAGTESYVSPSLTLLYLETLQPSIALNLRATRQEIDFKAYAALPVALIIAFTAGRLASEWLVTYAAIAIGLALGIGSFLVAVWSNNKALDNTYADMAMALLIAETRSDSAKAHQPPSVKRPNSP
jgi:hypothetical protein